jgi:hypothetical protein
VGLILPFPHRRRRHPGNPCLCLCLFSVPRDSTYAFAAHLSPAASRRTPEHSSNTDGTAFHTTDLPADREQLVATIPTPLRKTPHGTTEKHTRVPILARSPPSWPVSRLSHEPAPIQLPLSHRLDLTSLAPPGRRALEVSLRKAHFSHSTPPTRRKALAPVLTNIVSLFPADDTRTTRHCPLLIPHHQNTKTGR